MDRCGQFLSAFVGGSEVHLLPNAPASNCGSTPGVACPVA